MKILPVGELKTHFSKVLSEVQAGEEVIITYGKKRDNIAVIVPYAKFRKRNSIRLGLLKDRKMKIHDDFEMTEHEIVDL